MPLSRTLSLAAAAWVFAGTANAVTPAATLYGPSPYTSFADSPFKALGFSYFHLDDFESNSRTPGYAATTGGTILPAGASTDSVDKDDGVIDGSGTGGRSWFSQFGGNTTPVFTFEFDKTVLGTLPTHVGIVWTDVGSVKPDPEFPSIPVTDGFVKVSFVAYAADGSFLDSIQPAGLLGDGLVNGNTAEDRFFGIASAAGISKIEIFALYSTDWEVDHLQYGALNPVPEPGQWLLMALGLVGVAGAARLRRANAAAS